MVDKPQSQGFACLPYVRGLTEPITRLLRKHDIKVVNKPVTTLQQEFPSPKYRPPIEKQNNVVYRIPCADCPWNYIGETSRSFETRKKEHIRNVNKATRGSNIVKHVMNKDHSIDFNGAMVIDKGNRRSLKSLESWHTAKNIHAENNSKPLPGQYTNLVNKE